MNENYKIPNNAVVLLVGIAGSGKSTLTKKAFGNNSFIVSSDECRKEICGNEANQSVNAQAFELFYKKIEDGILEKKQVIADATNLDKFSRDKIYDIAKRYNVPIYALVFNISLDKIKEQNKMRERVVPEYVIDNMSKKMQIAYYQISEEIPTENIVDIINCNDIKSINRKKSR